MTDLNKTRIDRLCEYIQRSCHSGEPLRLKQLARQVNLSPFHFQRTFKASVGVTPKQYIEACRMKTLKQQLRTSDSVTNAIYDAGYSSSSRVYERLDTHLGMTPSEYRAGGRNVEVSYVSMDTPLGCMMAGATDRGLCFLQFGESPGALLEILRKEYPAAKLQATMQPYPEQLELWIESLSRYLRREQLRLDIPINVRATAFQLKVWRYLQSIPYGHVQSYSEVAKSIGRPRSSRAVARACASNPVAIVIPCHRVIRGDGNLGGYRWGIERKRALIDSERAARATSELQIGASDGT